jgi:hypothetical protein
MPFRQANPRNSNRRGGDLGIPWPKTLIYSIKADRVIEACRVSTPQLRYRRSGSSLHLHYGMPTGSWATFPRRLTPTIDNSLDGLEPIAGRARSVMRELVR